MSAAPPTPRRRRARRGSVERPVSGRTYRGTWLFVAFPLLLAAFSVARPAPLPRPDLPPAFDTVGARLLAADLATQFPDRSPGTPGAGGAASWFADQLRPYGFVVRTDRFRADVAGRGRLPFENLVVIATGRSQSAIAVVAHRDNNGVGSGANDNGSGTAALIELARSYANPAAASTAPSTSQRVRPAHTIVFLSTDGGALGGIGAAHFAEHSPLARDIVAVIDLDAIAGPDLPRLEFAGDRSRTPSATLLATAKRPPPAARPRLSVQLLRAGAVSRTWHVRPQRDDRRRPPAERRRRHTGRAARAAARSGRPCGAAAPRLSRRRPRARAGHLDVRVLRRPHRPRLGHPDRSRRRVAAVSHRGSRPVRIDTAPSHSASPGPAQPAQPNRLLALRRTALRGLRPGGLVAARLVATACARGKQWHRLARPRADRLRCSDARRLDSHPRSPAAAPSHPARRRVGRPLRSAPRARDRGAAHGVVERVRARLPAAVAPRVALAAAAERSVGHAANRRLARRPRRPGPAAVGVRAPLRPRPRRAVVSAPAGRDRLGSVRGARALRRLGGGGRPAGGPLRRTLCAVPKRRRAPAARAGQARDPARGPLLTSATSCTPPHRRRQRRRRPLTKRQIADRRAGGELALAARGKHERVRGRGTRDHVRFLAEERLEQDTHMIARAA